MKRPIEHAHWIYSSEGTHEAPPSPAASHYDVRMFRREFLLATTAESELKIEVSADSRYLLWCNGRLVARGPAKGDVHHQFFDSLDLSPFLVGGENVLAALVLDMSTVAHRPHFLGAPCSIMTYAGGFVLGGVVVQDGRSNEDISTDAHWKIRRDTAHRFQNLNTRFEGYHGYFEYRLSAEEPAGWRSPGFDDTAWEPATVLYAAELIENRRDPASPYGLLPRIIPMLPEDEPAGFADVFALGGDEPSDEARRLVGTSGNTSLEIPPLTKFEVIFDAGEMTTGFPILNTAGGRAARVTLTYAEALRLPWDTPGARLLGHQQSLSNLASHFADESTGWTFDRRGTISGWCDVWEPAGDRGDESFSPLHWRAFRYVGLRIETGGEPITLRTFRRAFCAYPYALTGAFSCSDESLNRQWDISVRTMRLCSHETFEDCVHYEQMQYAGDTMITSKLGMLVSGDYRIAKQALLHFDWSRIPEGLTQSRYPSRLLQVIPSWSLHWITNIRDYLLCSGDRDTVAALLPGALAVLDWFRRHADEDGLPGRLSFWNTADWCPWWQRGQPPGWDTGPTCVIASQYVVALDETAWLLSQFGQTGSATALEAEADKLRPVLHATFWSESEGLYFDKPGGPELSQYGNAWAVVAGAASASTRERLLARFPADEALAPVSFFGWHAIFSALKRCAAYDRMPGYLGPWDEMVAHGLDTWAEENTYWRSLCHAWTAHPAIDFLTRVLGVTPLEPGFATTLIEPHPCGLDHARGRVCTPHGPIEVEWRRRGDALSLEVNAPDQIRMRIVSPNGEAADIPAGIGRVKTDLAISSSRRNGAPTA